MADDKDQRRTDPTPAPAGGTTDPEETATPAQAAEEVRDEADDRA